MQEPCRVWSLCGEFPPKMVSRVFFVLIQIIKTIELYSDSMYREGGVVTRREMFCCLLERKLAEYSPLGSKIARLFFFNVSITKIHDAFMQNVLRQCRKFKQKSIKAEIYYTFCKAFLEMLNIMPIKMECNWYCAFRAEQRVGKHKYVLLWGNITWLMCISIRRVSSTTKSK